MQSHYLPIVKLTEEMVSKYLSEQLLDQESRDYGGLVTPDSGYSEPGTSASAIAVLTSLVCCPDSRFHKSEEIASRALLYCEHLLRAQHEDGTVDLRSTNFHDATMVGFSVQKLAYTYRLLAREAAPFPLLAQLRDSIRTFLVRGAAGMVAGGFHTPNHRWVLASGLSLLASILSEDALIEEANCYLQEGIDCTPAGEYTERSAGIYNVVNNRSLIIVAQELDREDLLNPVRRNLNMVMQYLEPDGSVFTLNSRRQDAGRTTFPINYYENYLLMAHKDGNRIYAGLATELLRLAEEQRSAFDGLGPVLTQFLLEDNIRETELPREPVPTRYVLENFDSGIVRRREHQVSVTVLSGHSIFLQYKVGELAVAAKLAGTFYGDKGRFIPAIIEKTDEGYVLKSHARWGYYRPLETPPPTSDWDGLPHQNREHAMVSDFDVTVGLVLADDSVELDIKVDGTDGVLIKLELLCTPGGWLEADGLRVPGGAGHIGILRDGRATYQLGPDAISIDGGFAEHNATTNMRGTEPQVQEVFTLYCTGYTPTRRMVVLRSSHTN